MSGYDIEKFDPPPDPDLVCCICQCVLDKAVECPCRHVFCQGCIERWLNNRQTCPTCRKTTCKQDLKPVLPLVQNMLNRLLMICDFRNNGCTERIMLEHFERHVKNCGYEMKACRFSKCGARILRMQLDSHENEQCEHRESMCEGECGLMIPLSDRPTHNCVAALKSHIDEKNRMIEQLKVKLHELNNLSQSLNDQLVELRQQLNDRNQIFSSDSSDSSDSDVTDFMSDDLSRDSWLDNAASNISEYNLDSATNNDTNEANNNSENTEGSDVVEQVERTVVNSLFELSSSLERIRNQMRAVLNSRLVQEQNANDEVRVPPASELDAIVNSSNINRSEAVGQHSNNSNNNHLGNSENGYDNENQRNRNDDEYRRTQFTTTSQDETTSDDRYSDANDSRISTQTEESHDENTSGSDVSDLNWISDSDSNHTPGSPFPPQPSEYNSAGANDSFRNENVDYDSNDIQGHVILSQPPDSPSDTTGSFSSIPSASSVASSPTQEEDHEGSQPDSVFTATPSTCCQSSPSHSNNSWSNSQDHNPRSPGSVSSYLSPKSPSVDSEHSAHFSNSSPAHSLSSVSTEGSGDCSKSEASHYKSDDNSCSPFTAMEEKSDTEQTDHEISANASPKRQSGCVSDSEPDENIDVQNGQKCTTSDEMERCETSGADTSLDYGGSVEESSPDELSETSTDSLDHLEMQEESDDTEGEHQQDGTCEASGDIISRCEPDSTQSPLTVQQEYPLSSYEGSSADKPVMISTATDSGDSEDSESIRYITKHVRHPGSFRNTFTERNENYTKTSPVVDDQGSTVDSGFTTGTSSPLDDVHQPFDEKKILSRKRKSAWNTSVSDEYKKRRSSGVSSNSFSDQENQSHIQGGPGSFLSNDVSEGAARYGGRRETDENDSAGNGYYDCKNSRGSAMTLQYSDEQANPNSVRTSPTRSKQSWRDGSQITRKNRFYPSRRSSQTVGSNDNNAQSLNVKIDLSLINYSARIGNEPTSTTIPTTAVVHSANISPIPTVPSFKREQGHTASRQYKTKNISKSSTPKQDDTSHKSTRRQRFARLQRQELQKTSRNTRTSPARGANNVSNTYNREFPNSWRDSSDSSSDNTWQPSSDCNDMDDTITEGEDGTETDSSYEVQVPKSTAALLEEYASDDSDESWTVDMN